MKKVCIHFMRIINYLIPKSKNKVLFISKPNYSDNTRALFEYMEKYDEYKKVWLVDNENSLEKLKNRGINAYSIKSIKGFIAFMSSKYIISNQNNLLNLKSKNQIYISLWHGMPLKSIHYLDDNCDKKSLEADKRIDYTISTSKVMKLAMASAFNIEPKKVMISGQPRNDMLFRKDRKLQEIIEINISKFDKVIFYLPTYRTGVGRSEGEVNEMNVINIHEYNDDELNEYLKIRNILLLVKFHPVQEKFFNKNLYTNIKIIPSMVLNDKLIDLYQILSQSDLLITDYSSVYFDYLVLGKPILFLNTDEINYSNSRGFVFDNPSFWRPGPKVNNLNNLMNEIDKLLNEKNYYKEEREHINSLVNTYMDGKSSQRVYEVIFKK